MIKPSDEVRFSDYTIMSPLPEGNDVFLAINTLSNGVAMLGRDVKEAIERGIRMDSVQFAADLPRLAEANIIVSKQKNELYSFRSTMTRIMGQAENLGFQVHPTMGCNLACTYCYASPIRDAHTQVMSEDTARSIVDWIKSQIMSIRPKGAGLDFCGGEALLCPDIIFGMSREISDMCKAAGVNFEVSLTTNGVFLNRSFVEELLDGITPALTAAQVSIDGPQQIHDSRRVSRDGSSSYNSIINNLYELNGMKPEHKKRIRVSLRIHVDRHNVGSLMSLAEQLHPLLSDKDGVVGGAYFARVQSENLPHDEYAMSNTEFVSAVEPLWYEIWDRFHLDFSYHRKMFPCSAIKEGSWGIGPDGALYLCQAVVGNHDYAVGHVDTGVDIDAIHEHHGLMPWDECVGKCPLVTWCYGGCRHEADVCGGGWDKRLCTKKDTIAEGMAYYRFKHRDRIAKWLYNRANGIVEDEYADFEEILVS